MHIVSIKKAHEDNLSNSEKAVLERLSDDLFLLSKEAIQLAIRLKENSNKIERLIEHASNSPSKVQVCPKAPIMEGFTEESRNENGIVEGRIAESHYPTPTSAY